METMKAHDVFIQSATPQFGGRRRRVVLAILVSLVLGTVTYGQERWIFDDFEDGNAVDGHPFTWLAGPSKPGGTRDVVGGDYVLTHDGEADSDVLESVGATGDVSVRSQLRFLNSGVGNAAIYARAVAGISYYAGLTRGGRVHVGKSGGGAYHSVQTNLRPVDQDITVQLDIIGDHISVKAWPSGDPEPEAPLAAFVDSTLTVGTVGVYMYGNTPESSVAFRDFGTHGLSNTFVPIDGTLSWTPGENAELFDVYLGTDFHTVTAADRANPLDVLVSEGQDANAFELEGLLELGQTYYWRIDEVISPQDLPIVYPGEVATFATEPVAFQIENITAITSGSEADTVLADNTINGSGLTIKDEHSTAEEDMWMMADDGTEAWIQFQFDKVYKLHQMWVWNFNGPFELDEGVGFKDVTVETSENGTDWTVLSDVEFAQATALATYTANTALDFNGMSAQSVRLTVHSTWGTTGVLGLSEVRFFYVPMRAGQPQPADGDTGVDPDTALSWRAGRGADSHEVYLSTDRRQALLGNMALVDVVSENGFYPGPLEPGTTYYWKINEVNEPDSLNIGEGNWIVDDFEDGDVADGHPFTWQKGPASPGYAWAMMDGDYVLTSSRISGIPGTTSSTVLESVGATGDVSARCQFHFLDLNGQSAGMSVRSLDGHSYYAGASRGGVTFVGQEGGDAFYQLTDLRPRDEDIILQVDVVGNDISMKAWRLGDPEPDAPLLTFTDATLTTRSVAIWFEARNDKGAASVAFREFGTNGLANTSDVPLWEGDVWEFTTGTRGQADR